MRGAGMSCPVCMIKWPSLIGLAQLAETSGTFLFGHFDTRHFGNLF